jgi:hypothetical protein
VQVVPTSKEQDTWSFLARSTIIVVSILPLRGPVLFLGGKDAHTHVRDKDGRS